MLFPFSFEYGAKKFMVGPQLPKKIRALASYKDYTFAAYGTNIGVFKRAHQVCIQKRINLWHEYML